MKCGAGSAGITTSPEFPGAPFPGPGPLALRGKKSLALTVPQVRALLQVVLPRPTLTPQRALALLGATQRQNHNAYRSHRKRILRRLLDSS